MPARLSRSGSTRRGRVVLGTAAAIVPAPYLTLKVLWVGGSTVGMADPAAFGSSAYQTANVASIGADLIAVGVAVVLTAPIGRRLPAPLVLLPAWVATGLLGTVLVLAPIAAPFAATRSSASQHDALRGWVYALVYGGFCVQAVVLLTLFALYARDRWLPDLRQALSGPVPSRPIRRATALAAMCGVLAVLQLGWGFGMTAGLGAVAGRQTSVDRATLAVHGFFVLAAALGTLLFARPNPARWWLPPALVWCGTASMVTWGSYGLALDAWNPSLTSPMLAATTAANVVCGVCAAVLTRRHLNP